MLSKYRDIIYKTEDEKNKVKEECIKTVMELNPKYTKEEIYNYFRQKAHGFSRGMNAFLLVHLDK